jgi:hypothetical protein
MWFWPVKHMSLHLCVIWLTKNLSLIIQILSRKNNYLSNFIYPLRCLRLPHVEDHWYKLFPSFVLPDKYNKISVAISLWREASTNIKFLVHMYRVPSLKLYERLQISFKRSWFEGYPRTLKGDVCLCGEALWSSVLLPAHQNLYPLSFFLTMFRVLHWVVLRSL